MGQLPELVGREREGSEEAVQALQDDVGEGEQEQEGFEDEERQSRAREEAPEIVDLGNLWCSPI